MRTQKTDWFNDLLAGHEGVLVSGHASFAKAMELPEEAVVALRFAANRKEIYGYFLTIECDHHAWESIKTILAQSDQARALHQRLEEIFQGVIVTLIFAPKRSDIFSVSKGLSSFRDMNGEDLANYFGRINPSLVDNPGASKNINRSINDGFQDWGRNHLSKFLTVNDFDAIATIYNKKPYIFELKRVEQDINVWQPYLDDQSNYAALLCICTNIGADLRVVTYQAINNEYVALHFITNATATQIEGRKIVCRADQIVGSPFGMKYISTRRRE